MTAETETREGPVGKGCGKSMPRGQALAFLWRKNGFHPVEKGGNGNEQRRKKESRRQARDDDFPAVLRPVQHQDKSNAVHCKYQPALPGI